MDAKQWTALKKQPDKAKKMLSALHMSPAYLRVSWSELDEGDQNKVSKWMAKNGSGWFEQAKPTSTPKGIKNVAPEHRKAAVKKSTDNVLRKPMKKEKSVRTEKKEEIVQIPKEEKANSEKYAVDFLRRNPIKLEDIDYYKGRASKDRHDPHGIPDAIWQDAWRKVGLDGEIMILGSDGKIYDTPFLVDKIIVNQKYVTAKEERTEVSEEEPKELDIMCPECHHKMIPCSKNYSIYTKGAIKEGEPICSLHGSMEMIKQQRDESSPTQSVDKGEIRVYKNYGLVWKGKTSQEGVTSIDYYQVVKNPPKDVSYQGIKDFHGDSASLYFSKITNKTYTVPRMTNEYLVHLRNEKVPDDSYSSIADRAGINLEGLYIDDIDGIRFRMANGAFKDKTAFRCPECYRGLVFNTDSKLVCGEHGSLTSPEKAIDLRKIGIDDKTTEWAEQQFKGWLSEAKTEGFKTVAEYVDSMKGKDDHGYGKYAELGRGLEATFITVSKKITQEINNQLFKKIMDRLDEAEKEFNSTGKLDEWQAGWDSEYSKIYGTLPELEQKQIDSRMYGLSNYIHEEKLKKEKTEKKSATLIYLEGAYQKRLEATDTSPIPLSNPEKDEITDAIAFLKTIRLPIIMHFDMVDVQIRFWRNAQDELTSLELIVFDEGMNEVYHNLNYDMNIDAEDIFKIRDDETKALLERRKAEKEEIRKKDEARVQEERKKKRFKFNRTTYSLYLKTYPYAMSYFLNDIVHIPVNADPSSLTDEELDKINSVVAEGYDIISDTGIYTVEWFKERNEQEREEEAKYSAIQEKEKLETKTVTLKPKLKYFKTKEVKGKLKKEYIKEAYPFEFGGVSLFSHKEGAGWHVTEQTTGLMFTSGTSQNEAESAAKEIISSRGGEKVLAMINQAKGVMESQGGIA